MLSERERHVLRQGYLVLHHLGEKPGLSGLTWAEFYRWLDRGWLKHDRSNLQPDRGVSWERYRVTPAGRRALAEAEGRE